ncbi:MAG: hypothetical protein AAF447_11400 [Myxococcota bacterium]
MSGNPTLRPESAPLPPLPPHLQPGVTVPGTARWDAMNAQHRAEASVEAFVHRRGDIAEGEAALANLEDAMRALPSGPYEALVPLRDELQTLLGAARRREAVEAVPTAAVRPPRTRGLRPAQVQAALTEASERAMHPESAFVAALERSHGGPEGLLEALARTPRANLLGELQRGGLGREDAEAFVGALGDQMALRFHQRVVAGVQARVEAAARDFDEAADRGPAREPIARDLQGAEGAATLLRLRRAGADAEADALAEAITAGAPREVVEARLTVALRAAAEGMNELAAEIGSGIWSNAVTGAVYRAFPEGAGLVAREMGLPASVVRGVASRRSVLGEAVARHARETTADLESRIATGEMVVEGVSLAIGTFLTGPGGWATSLAFRALFEVPATLARALRAEGVVERAERATVAGIGTEQEIEAAREAQIEQILEGAFDVIDGLR